MKKFFAMILIAVGALSMTACSKVPAGNVGVKVNLLGGEKGVEAEELGTGRYWIGWNEELYLFPTFTQTKVWTRSETEGSPENQEFTAQTKEGLVVTADIGISYHIEADKVTDIFQKYRKGIDEITDVYLRSIVSDAFVSRTSQLKVDETYNNKTELLALVLKDVRAEVEPLGIIVERLNWRGNIRVPDSVTASINAKVEATQKSVTRRNEVEQSKAEADKLREKAKGEADSKLALAAAEAESISIRGKALEENPKVLMLEALNRWDGKTPATLVIGSDGVDVTKLVK